MRFVKSLGVPMRRLLQLFVPVSVVCLAFAGSAVAKPPSDPSFTLKQNAALVHPGEHSGTAVQLTSTQSPYTYGAVDLSIPTSMTLSQLSNLSTDYKFTLGSCWGGSPRFEAWVTDPSGNTQKIFFYIGPPTNYTGCALGVWSSTGNLASPSSYVDDTEVGGGPYDTYSNAQAQYGSYPLTAIWLDADGGWNGDQTVEFDNAEVNSELFTFEH